MAVLPFCSRLFDSSISEAGPKPSQFHSQPANFRYKTSGSYQQNDHRRSEIWHSAPNTTKSAERPKIQLEETDGPAPDSEDKDLLLAEDLPGTGTVIALLDTGINKHHKAFSSSTFEDKIIECKNFIYPDEDCEDMAGHGTQCAGVACGLTFTHELSEDGVWKNLTFNSFAPGAKVMVCKISHNDDDDESASHKALNAALDYIISYNNNPRNVTNKVDVISISFGFDHFDKEQALKIQEAVSKDIVVVCCASNSGSKIPNPIAYPGRLGNVLCIGACDKHGQATKFTSEGREIDFVELGEDVWAPTIGRDDAITAIDGTSISAPAVAGLICWLLQDLKKLSSDSSCQLDLYHQMHNVWCMRELLKTMSVMQGHHDKAKGYGKLLPERYFNKGNQERVRICKEILGISN